MRNRCARLLSAVGVAAILAAGAAGADENRIANGQFDDADGVDGWDNLHTDYSVMVPDPEDADDCPGSGSMLVDNTQSTVDFATAQFRTCTAAISAGELYQVVGRFRFLDGTSTSNATLIVYFFPNGTCSGGFLAIDSTSTVSSAVTGWQERLKTGIEAPQGALSAEVRIHLVKSSAADPKAELLVDRVRFDPDGLIAIHDFEIGDLCRWSDAQP
jgi:hypothetical protein